MTSNPENWDETRREPLRQFVRDGLLLAKTRVDYYDEKAASLSNKLRWVAAISGATALLTAGLLPWLLRIPGEEARLVLVVAAAISALIAPALLAWSKARGWSGDLQTWQRASSMARFVETELEDIETRLYLHDYDSVGEIIQSFRRTVRRWEFVLQLVPSERQDDDLVKRFYRRAKIGLGIDENDDKAQQRETETETTPSEAGA